jgi:hypothetical protein
VIELSLLYLPTPYQRFIMLAAFLTARLALIVLLISSTTSIILCALCLSAGHSEGFLEDFAIARVSVVLLFQVRIKKDRPDHRL